MLSSRLQLCLVTSACIALIACGEKPSEPAAAPAEPAAAAPEQPAAPAAPAAPATAAPATPPTTELPAIPAGAKVWFIEPADGAKLQGPAENGKVNVPVKMGAEGIAVKPAGAIEAGSGHHHVVIDAEPGAEGVVVPKDDQHLHFGQGQTEATLALTPGEHTLHLQFADGIHRSYGPKLTAAIKVTVSEAAAGVATARDKTKAKPESDDKTHKH